MKALADSTVAVLGLGLMGGSFALALQRRPGTVGRVLGMDRDPRTVQDALSSGAIVRGEMEPGNWLQEADIVVLATPVRTILSLLPVVAAQVRPGTLLLDLGSTKRDIVRAMDRLPPELVSVGGHPMCGKETSGWSAADPALFQGKRFLVVPTARSSDAALDAVNLLAECLGARPLRMEADRHDRIVGVTSHLPYLVATGLVETVGQWAAAEPDIWNVAASGFADTTRVAASQTDMMLDILLTNRANAVAQLRECARRENELADLLASGNQDALRERLGRAASARRAWGGMAKHG